MSAHAQGTRRQDADLLAALLAEVRGLRAAMEQMAAAGPRVQLALGRLQLQEQRVNATLRRLETVRDSIRSAEEELTDTQAPLAGMEKMFRDGISPPEGNPLNEMIAALKKGVAGAAENVQRLQAEEALLQQQIVDEQARWTEINRTLEELERALGGR
jgi:predicted  nucleic acid-binding Zn-ribbon protein